MNKIIGMDHTFCTILLQNIINKCTNNTLPNVITTEIIQHMYGQSCVVPTCKEVECICTRVITKRCTQPLCYSWSCTKHLYCDHDAHCYNCEVTHPCWLCHALRCIKCEKYPVQMYQLANHTIKEELWICQQCSDAIDVGDLN